MNKEYKEITLDAKGEILGKLATKIANILRGKDQTDFKPNVVKNIRINVINPEKITVTGNKMADKMYYRHSMWPGGLKSIALKDLIIKNPTEVITNAVKGMLPKNRLRKVWLKNLIIKNPVAAESKTNQG